MRAALVLVVACGSGSAAPESSPAPVAPPAPVHADAAAPEPVDDPPTITGLAPATGGGDGGTRVVLTGTKLVSGGLRNITVWFGAKEGKVVQLTDDGHLVVESPAGTTGAVDVRVRFDPGGERVLAKAFTYRRPTTIADLGALAGSGNGSPIDPDLDDDDAKPVTGRIAVGDKQAFDDTTLPVDIVLAKIQAAYMAGIKRCYREQLKIDATARGKLTLKLTVDASGRPTTHEASGLAATLNDCVNGQMAAWRFPVPRDKDSAPTEASFVVALQLTPD